MTPYQVFTSQNYPYLQKHSGVPVTEIATLKRVFFVEPLGGGWWSEPPGPGGQPSKNHTLAQLFSTINRYYLLSLFDVQVSSDGTFRQTGVGPGRIGSC